jgi:AcrR family transcriptional regulator
MDPVRRQRDKFERRSQIMDAAECVFLTTTVEHATMEQIAQAADLSKGTLYLYFKDKEDLYLSIAQRAVEELVERERAVALRMQRAAGYAWFEAGMRCYADYALEYKDRFRVAMSWLSAQAPRVEGSPAFAAYRAKVAEAFQFGLDALERGKADGSVRPELDTSQSLFNLWGGLVGLLLMLSNPEEVSRRLPFDVDFRHALDGHLEVLLSSVKAQTRAREGSVEPGLDQSGVRARAPSLRKSEGR